MPALERGTTPAFVFDIDGVLVKGKNPIPGAKDTIQLLQNLDVPFIFLTNGGGLTEEDHVARLGLRLEIPTLDKRQFVQSHTPYHNLVKLYADKPILVLGGQGDQIRNVAEAYGFKKVFTSSDLYADMQAIHPFPEMTHDHHIKFGRKGARASPGQSPYDSETDPSDDEPEAFCPSPSQSPIAAILVWSSPRDWVLDLQVTLDLLLSTGGVLASPRSAKNGDPSLPNNGYLQDGQPMLHFCNADFEWATQAPTPRLAQGAFRCALEALWASATKGAELIYQTCGKPTELTYEFGEGALSAWNERKVSAGGFDHAPEVQNVAATEEINDAMTTIALLKAQHPRRVREISTVWMIGDNPESDIAGANAFVSRLGYQWQSVLLETGVYEPGTSPAHVPTRFAKDVKEAVTEILAEEGLLA